jgi:hypothetical protein
MGCDDMDLIIILLMLIIPFIAQIWVSTSYSKYKQINNNGNIKGFEVARKILDESGLKDIYVVEVKGNLTDHYDPERKVVRLSSDIYHGSSIASLAVASHECGHALQDKDGYLYMKVRSLIYPVVHFSTSISYFIIFIGLLLESLDLIWLGIILVGSGLVFQIVTLPVEINASIRAGKLIDKLKLANQDDQDGVKIMLSAAASTYVAGVLSSALELLRLILLFGNRRD